MDEDNDEVMAPASSASGKEEKKVALATLDPSLTPWIEKYRPKKLDDVAHQDEVVQTLRRSLQSGNVSAPAFAPIHPCCPAASSLAVLRPSGHGQDLDHSRSGSRALWVRDFDGCLGAFC
jgi:hypothetical protein